MSTVIYGISNCDTITKTRRWLEAHDVVYTFHDYKKQGVDAQQLERWVDEFGWEQVMNRRGSTWRKLPQSCRESMDRAAAIAVMQQHPSIIRRPVIEHGNRRLIGFDVDALTRTLLE